MSRFGTAATMTALALWLCSCATAPEIPYDHASAGVHSIGIVTPDMGSGPTVLLASTVGQSFGLVGAIIDAGIQEGRDRRFKTILAQQSFLPYDAFQQALQDGLKGEGYDVSVVPVTRSGHDYLKTYPTNADPQVDAYLDIVFWQYGYLSAGISSDLPYRPHSWLKVRLVSAKDSSVLMEQTFIYDPLGTPEHVVTFAPAPAYAFADVSEMEARPADAVAGLRDAMARPAQGIATLLK